MFGHLLLIGFTAIICYIIGNVVYNLYFSPLAKFPGPFWAKVSALPNFYHAMTGYRHIWLWQCHQVYGNVFRFHPNGVLSTSPNAYPIIYGAKANVKKGKFYEVWPRNVQNLNTLSTVDKEVHARKRRILNGVFSEKAVRAAESFIIRHVDRWCELLVDNTSSGWSEPQNMTTLAESLTFDIMGDLSFGKSFEIKEKKENPFKIIPHTISGYMQFIYPITQSPMLNLWVWLKPRGLDNIFQHLTPKEVRDYYDFVDANVLERTKEEEEAQLKALDEENVRKDMFHYLFTAKNPETGEAALSPEELNGEANLLIIAGADTTSTALCSFFFYISRSSLAYNKVVREMRETFDSVDEITGGTKLSSCQYLRACLDEAMRMTPAGPSEMIREVLPGGIEVDGKFIPGGVMIGIAHWAILHSEEVYGDPSVYRPERWIVDEATGVTAEDVALAQSAFQPFSMGFGNCVGQKLAILELLITIGRTLYRMDVRPAPGSILGQGALELEWGMRSKDHFKVKDAYITIKDGPLVQFKKRGS
ncbi:benzoate 4-monooxygenase cytochrome P450 [Mollisia scopiformis]|uniref:Benzoate 4-monooxygenase cytochrome P450 n=1 Tax=Mollisia scopiformis TaxID=149040 RepID=A0A194WZ58_MOLSC|nr:benzoate 4-monooxygenase cytochrome P450 [Mollisia scopiformis]KUJ13243.1 benzoate 4-monooxygenase cytochrome P450 [Mollisia scopiformis]